MALKIKPLLTSLLNGSASVDGVETAIVRLESQIAASLEKLQALDIAAPDLALADDDAALDRAEEERRTHKLIIQKARLALPLLNEKLTSLRELKLHDRIAHHLAKNKSVFESLEKTLHDAAIKNREARRVYESAAAELGEATAARLIQPIYFGGLLTMEAVDAWRDYMRVRLYPASPPLTVVKPLVPRNTAVKPSGSTATGLGSLQGPVGLHQPVARPSIAKPTNPPPTPPPPLPPAQVMPKPDADGNVTVVFNRPYYTDDNVRHLIGETRKLPFAVAEKALLAGSADLADGGEP